MIFLRAVLFKHHSLEPLLTWTRISSYCDTALGSKHQPKDEPATGRASGHDASQKISKKNCNKVANCHVPSPTMSSQALRSQAAQPSGAACLVSMSQTSCAQTASPEPCITLSDNGGRVGYGRESRESSDDALRSAQTTHGSGTAIHRTTGGTGRRLGSPLSAANGRATCRGEGGLREVSR